MTCPAASTIPPSHEGFASLAVPTYRASTIVFPDADAYASRKYRGPDGWPFEPAVYFTAPLLFRPGVQQSMLERTFVAELLTARTKRGKRKAAALD